MVLGIGVPLMVVLGIVVGTLLSRPDDPPEEKAVTVADGVIDGTAWRVDAERDVEGETCAFLYQDGAQLNGACDETPQDVTIGDQTVVFGKAATGEPMTIEFTNGESVEVAPAAVEGVEGHFYAEVVEGDIDVNT